MNEFNILIVKDFTYKEWNEEIKCYKWDIRYKQNLQLIPNFNEKDYIILNTNIPMFGKSMYELDDMLKVLSEWLRNNLARHVAIIKRSIDNLDKVLWLFDLSEEWNFTNGTALANVVWDHINFRYNINQPSSPMFDYEITLIQAWMKDIMTTIKHNWEFDKLSDYIKKNYIETCEMLNKARQAQKQLQKEVLEAKLKAEEEMKAKQEVLDNLKREREILDNDVIKDKFEPESIDDIWEVNEVNEVNKEDIWEVDKEEFNPWSIEHEVKDKSKLENINNIWKNKIIRKIVKKDVNKNIKNINKNINRNAKRGK